MERKFQFYELFKRKQIVIKNNDQIWKKNKLKGCFENPQG
jgi:hypothetical protein